MADAGSGGAEITDVHHSATQPLDPAGHGWGTAAWVSATQAALEKAKARGMKIDLTAGPAWPSAVPSITPDSAAAIKELAYGTAERRGGRDVQRRRRPRPRSHPPRARSRRRSSSTCRRRR